MINPKQLAQTLNQTLCTHLSVYLNTETAAICTAKQSQILLLEEALYSIFGNEEDRRYLSLIKDLLTLSSDDEALYNSDMDWIQYLSGSSQELPKQPAVNPEKAYRLCKLSISEGNFDSLFATELCQLSIEILQGDLLWRSSNALLYLLEDQSSIPETLFAFHETLLLEFNQSVQMVLSARVQSSGDLRDCYTSLLKLEQLALTGATLGPIIFETHMTQLILDEWMSTETGPIYRCIQRLGIAVQLDEEMLKTIEMHFRMNLNLTDTARALFIHRNTLIYRLDKIQKQLGFDLRNFDDCYRLKVLLRIK